MSKYKFRKKINSLRESLTKFIIRNKMKYN